MPGVMLSAEQLDRHTMAPQRFLRRSKAAVYPGQDHWHTSCHNTLIVGHIVQLLHISMGRAEPVFDWCAGRGVAATLCMRSIAEAGV
jgi:hypothetical protein